MRPDRKPKSLDLILRVANPNRIYSFETAMETTINAKNNFSIDNILSKPNKMPCFRASENFVISDCCNKETIETNNNNEQECPELCERKFPLSGSNEMLTGESVRSISAPDSSCSDDVGEAYMSDGASEESNCEFFF